MNSQRNPISVPAWRRNAKAGIPLAQLASEAMAENPAPIQAARPSVPFDLGRIIRPEAATRWLLPNVAAVTPAYIEAVLRGALGGNHVQQWELFDLMEDTWPRLVKNLNEIKRAVVALDWQCKPWAEEDTAPTDSAKEKAKLVSHAVWSMRPAQDSDENGFEQTLYDILDAWAKGVSVQEIEWEQRAAAGQSGDAIVPRCTFWVHPQNYAWHQEGWMGLATTSERQDFLAGRASVERFPEDKFLIARCKARSGSPLAGALLRPLAWWWCAANFSAEWFLGFAQIFGVPIRWANYDPNTPGLLANISDMLENMGNSAWAAFPAGTTLELKEPMKAGTDNPQIAMLDRADKQADLLILGQTLTTDVGDSGSRSLGEVHEGVREGIIRAAADFAASVVNLQLVPSILRLNFGDDTEAPEFCAEEEEQEDAKANAERDQILLNAGVALPKDWFYKRHQVPLPAQGEEVIESQPAAPQIGFGYGGSSAPETEARHHRCSGHAIRAQDATDKVVDAALEDLTGVQAKWLGGVKPFFRELIAAAGHEAISDAELIRALNRAQAYMPELFGRLDHKALEDSLFNAMSAGVANGVAQGFMQRRNSKAHGGSRAATRGGVA